MNTVAEIRAEMAKQRISIKELSELTGMPRTTLSARLNEHSKFDLDELDRICVVLGVPGWELMRRASQTEAIA